MTTITAGAMRISKVVEKVGGGLPLSKVMPNIDSGDLAMLKQWYWDDALNDDPAKAMFVLSLHSWIVEVDGLRILIDSCTGNHKPRSLPTFNQLNTPYLERLGSLGLDPADIDLVLCTHLHCDHVGWNTQLLDGRWVPTFPNARYVFSRRDYDHFSTQTESELHRSAFLDSVLPVVEAGQSQLVDSDAIIHRSVGDGIWLEDASGHSIGSCVIHAQRDGPHALFPGDVIHHPIQFLDPEYSLFVDDDREKAVKTRMRYLDRYANTDTIIMPAHFQHESAGYIRREKGKYSFEFLKGAG